MFDSRYSFPSRRSNIVGRHGVVATSQPLAAQAGLAILRQGGNAIDAAIATVATLGVVEPMMTGIGGDAFALIWSAANKKLYGLNASGLSPAGLSASHVRQLGHTSFPRHGGLSVTTPGAVRGWELALSRFGSLPLSRLLTDAISYAENGFPVSEVVAKDWAMGRDLLNRLEDTRRVWLPYKNRRPPHLGEIFRNPDLASTLQAIASDGPDAFYHGPIAQQIADAVQADGGVLTVADLANCTAEWVEPISTAYRAGHEIVELPPNGQGLTALLALNIANGFDAHGMGPGSYEWTHLMMEATKLAFADAQRYIADPNHMNMSVEALLSPTYTKQRQSLIDNKRALVPRYGQPNQEGDTVYLTVADEAGNMVSWIQSLSGLFGSCVTAGATGVQLQNRGANFSLEEGHPNEAAGGKRPYHTIIPAFIMREGAPWASFGIMGGFMQPQGHLQVASNLIDFAMTPQAAIDAPRFRWQQDKLFALEPAFGENMANELRLRGHQIMPFADSRDVYFGGGQIILRDDESGVYMAGSESRIDGAAVAF